MLFGDLGGQVGLWLGLSVLTLFEVVELIFDLLQIGAQRRKRRKSAINFSEKMNNVAVVERL